MMPRDVRQAYERVGRRINDGSAINDNTIMLRYLVDMVENLNLRMGIVDERKQHNEHVKDAIRSMVKELDAGLITSVDPNRSGQVKRGGRARR